MDQGLSLEHHLGVEYDKERPRAERLAEYAIQSIRSLCRASGIDGAIVSFRIKDRQGAIKKVLRRECFSILNLADFCGVRVVVRSPTTCENVAWILKTNFDVDVERSEDKTEEAAATQFGYRSIHLVLKLGVARLALPEASDLDGLSFEVQIRTILQHGWAEATHAAYKIDSGTPISEQSRRGLAAAASLIESADELLELSDPTRASGSQGLPIRFESMAEPLADQSFVLSVEAMDRVRPALLRNDTSDIDLAVFLNAPVASVPLKEAIAMPAFVTIDEIPSLKRKIGYQVGSNGYVFPGVLRALAHLDRQPFTVRLKRARVNCNVLLAGSNIALVASTMQRLGGNFIWGESADSFKIGATCGQTTESATFTWRKADSTESHSSDEPPQAGSMDLADPRTLVLEIRERVPFAIRTRKQESAKDLLPARSGTVILTRVSLNRNLGFGFYAPLVLSISGARFDLVPTDSNGLPLRGEKLHTIKIGDETMAEFNAPYFTLGYECVSREVFFPIAADLRIRLTRNTTATVKPTAAADYANEIRLATCLGPTSTVAQTAFNLVPRFADTSNIQALSLE